MQLAKGLKTKGVVLEVDDNFDSFMDTKSEKGGKRYCHFIIIQAGEVQINAQYCSVAPVLTEFEVGDEISFDVKSFRPEAKVRDAILEMHTIGLIGVVKKFAISEVPHVDVPVLRHLNLSGTPEVFALQAAVTFASYRPDATLESITTMARSLTAFLRTEYELNTES